MQDDHHSAWDPIFATLATVAVSKESGLNLAVACMQRGEKAIVYIQDPK